MEVPTYITEASALIDGIHEIKQWVYEGFACILVPTCTYEQVERAYKASIAPKDVPKDAATPRSSGRPARKEQLLFDINPRAAWEFLSRAKSEKGVAGVLFQQEDEEFTQWREEDEKAAEKVETPQAAPTSFAEALLRKLNMKGDSESNGPKAPAKPRLVSRSNEPKSPWKYQKIPTVSSHGLSTEAKPLFSCTLWRLYEREKNPLMPEYCKLLVGQKAIETSAAKLEIPVETLACIRSSLLKAKAKSEHRLKSGELEATFPEAATLTNTNDHSSTKSSESHATNGHMSPEIRTLADDAMKEEEKHALEELPSAPTQLVKQQELLQPQDTALKLLNDPELDEPQQVMIDFPKKQSTGGSGIETTLRNEQKTVELQVPAPISILSKSGDFKNSTEESRPSTASAQPDSKGSDLDSDEEIIVFTPRSRRFSGKNQKDRPRSRPATSSGLTPTILKAAPKDSSRPSSSAGKSPTVGVSSAFNENTMNGDKSQAGESKAQIPMEKIKSKIESTLKPESPVFTPGKPFIQSLQQPKSEAKPEPSPEPVLSSPPRSPALPISPRNGPPRQPRAVMQQRQLSQEQIRQRENQQRESEKMIERQREAIQRRARLVDKPVQKTAEKAEEKGPEKPAPRQIQMEPTNNPTIIDPDAFDRSYVVQAPSSSPSINSPAEKRRSKAPQARGNAIRRAQGSPKRSSRTPEPEIDFVLKSGAPRSSAHGKGKLWVP